MHSFRPGDRIVFAGKVGTLIEPRYEQSTSDPNAYTPLLCPLSCPSSPIQRWPLWHLQFDDGEERRYACQYHMTKVSADGFTTAQVAEMLVKSILS